MTPTEPRRAWPNTLARGLAAGVLVLGLLAAFIRHAPPTTWALPLRAGPFEPGWHLTELSRTPVRVQIDLVRGRERATLHLEHGANPHPPPEAIPVGRYRLVPGTVHPPPADLLAALADRIGASEAQWSAPPPCVRPTGPRPSQRQLAEQLLNELALLATVASLLALGPELLRALPRVRALIWTGLGLVVLGAAGLTRLLGTAGVGHANQHGYDRLFDLLHGTPAPLANLSLLHGQGYYTLMGPVVWALPGVSVFDLALLVASVAAIPWFLWLRLVLQDEERALVAIAVAVTTPVYLRDVATESMYVPVLAYLGVALLLWELHLRDGRSRWLFAALPPTFLAMQTRAELILLIPAWVAWMMLARQPTWVMSAGRRPAVWAALFVSAAAFGPRLAGFLFTDKPAMTSASVYDPLRDPRTALLALACLGCVGWLPGLRRRLAPLLARPTVAALGLVLVGAWTWNHQHRPIGFDPWWNISPLLDAPITAPWLPVLAVAGAVHLLRTAPAVGSFLTAALLGAWLLYLPRHDCLSTYVRTSLHLLPLFGALVASGLELLPRGRRPLTVVLLGAAVLWSVPWLSLRFPKQYQGDLLLWAVENLPPNATVVWLADEDLEPEAPQGLHLDRLAADVHLRRFPRVVSIGAWRAGELPTDAPIYFLRTTDCHRVLLRRSPPHLAWTGTEALPWRYLKEPMVSTERRVAIEGLPAEPEFLQPACAEVAKAVRSTMFERVLVPKVAGSIYEELQGSSPRIGLYEIAPAPPPPRSERLQ